MEEYKTVEAYTSIEVNCVCPYCNDYLDILGDVSEVLDEYNSAKDCDVEIRCPACKGIFVVTDIHY